jgi:hypothetical protein
MRAREFDAFYVFLSFLSRRQPGKRRFSTFAKNGHRSQCPIVSGRRNSAVRESHDGNCLFVSENTDKAHLSGGGS